jgi:hypothetical protein
MAMRLLITLVLATFAASTFAQVYRWVDDSGQVHFGDRPPADGAEQVRLPPSSTYAPRQLPSTLGDEKQGEPAEAAETVAYTSVKIVKPAEDDTIRDNTGRVELEVALEPPLQEGHRLAVLVDGRSVFDQLTTTAVALTNVDRGTHNIQIKVLDADGSQVTSSAPVTFHLHRASVLTPPRPAPRG